MAIELNKTRILLLFFSLNLVLFFTHVTSSYQLDNELEGAGVDDDDEYLWLDEEEDGGVSRTAQSGLQARKRSCDTSSGKWVYDQSYPLYDSSCPYLTTAVTCRRNGRPDSDYEKWKPQLTSTFWRGVDDALVFDSSAHLNLPVSLSLPNKEGAAKVVNGEEKQSVGIGGDEEQEEAQVVHEVKKKKRRRAFSESDQTQGSFRYANVTTVPPSVDWRTKGAVTPVKNQGKCGSCWVFAAVACTEGLIKINTGELVALSEQELVDCVSSGHDNCQFGNSQDAFKFIMSNGLSPAVGYPYTGVQGTCRQNQSYPPAITGFECVPRNDESALLKAVANQPVLVAVDSSSYDFNHYTGDVFQGECGTKLDHSLTVVGYGTSADGTKYWIMKNSWGPKWGMKGYILMKRDVSAPEGQCGLAMEACYPTGGPRYPIYRPTSDGTKGDPVLAVISSIIIISSLLM